MPGEPAPEWLRLLAEKINLAVPAKVPERVEEARVPIVRRILRKVALPAVTFDERGVRAVIQLVVAALPVGAKARAVAGDAAWTAAGAAHSARAANSARAAALAAAWGAGTVWDTDAAAQAATWAETAAICAARGALATRDARAAARVKIRAIVIEELQRLEVGQ